jgi:hypothetical protein
MSQAELLLDRWRTLPEIQQQALMHLAEQLATQTSDQKPRSNLKGLWADQGFDLDEADLRELRQEMWQNFPREGLV